MVYCSCMRRKSSARRWGALYRKIDNGRLCVYCGVPATTNDHFVPLSVVDALAPLVGHLTGKVLVPACGECNSIAGAVSFPSIGAKRRFIQRRLAQKNAKLLASPDWSQEELEGVGYGLRTAIVGAQIRRDWLRARIAWRNVNNPAAVELGAIRAAYIGGPPRAAAACEHCGTPVAPNRAWQRFCSQKCKNAHHTRLRSTAVAAYRAKKNPAG